MLKPESFRGLCPLDPRQGLCLWTLPRALRRTPGPHPWVLVLHAWWAPLKHFTPGATSTSYTTAPPVQAGAHKSVLFIHRGKKTSLIFPSWSQSMLECKLDSGNMDLWFKNQFPVHTDQIQVTWTLSSMNPSPDKRVCVSSPNPIYSSEQILSLALLIMAKCGSISKWFCPCFLKLSWFVNISSKKGHQNNKNNLILKFLDNITPKMFRGGGLKKV